MPLGTNRDATYDDSVTDASQKLHQQDHDALHTLYNLYEGTEPADFAAAADLAALDTRVDTLEALDDPADKVDKATFPVLLGFALSDETTAITTGNAKLTARAPFAFTLTAVRASLSTASSSGIPTVDINEGGTTVLSTKLTIDANEKTSTTAATAAVISDSAIADDAELTFDIDVAGTGAKGLKVWLIGTRVLP